MRRKISALIGATLLALGLAVAIAPLPASGSVVSGSVPEGVHLKIVQVSSGKCLDVTGVSYSNGARLQLYDCIPGTNQWNQQFYFWKVSGQVYYRIWAAHSTLCLDIMGYSMDPGAPLQQYQCLGPDDQHRNQQFTMIPTGGFGFYIQPAHSGLRMTYQGAWNGAAVFQWPAVNAEWALVYP